jgi:hypothetical protein
MQADKMQQQPGQGVSRLLFGHGKVLDACMCHVLCSTRMQTPRRDQIRRTTRFCLNASCLHRHNPRPQHIKATHLWIRIIRPGRPLAIRHTPIQGRPHVNVRVRRRVAHDPARRIRHALGRHAHADASGHHGSRGARHQGRCVRRALWPRAPATELLVCVLASVDHCVVERRAHGSVIVVQRLGEHSAAVAVLLRRRYHHERALL